MIIPRLEAVKNHLNTMNHQLISHTPSCSRKKANSNKIALDYALNLLSTVSATNSILKASILNYNHTFVSI